jgi:hypothetical protein
MAKKPKTPEPQTSVAGGDPAVFSVHNPYLITHGGPAAPLEPPRPNLITAPPLVIFSSAAATMRAAIGKMGDVGEHPELAAAMKALDQAEAAIADFYEEPV